MNKIFVFPKLSSYDIGIRIGGAGLANCLFTFARAYIYSYLHNLQLLNPTWQRIGTGPYIRREIDKRHYFNLFKPMGVYGLKKYLILHTYKIQTEPDSPNELYQGTNKKSVIVFEGVKNYFADIYGHNSLIKDFIIQNVNEKYLQPLKQRNFDKIIGIHIRLGDFIDSVRAPITWYKEIISAINKKLDYNIKFFLFSDGKEEELRDILSIKNVERVYFGSSISDIIALSNCKIIIGSNSSFSCWGAYLGKVPSIFYKKDFGNIFNDGTCEVVMERLQDLPDNLFNKI